jgi:antitoxin component of MazEF toxin-antitoxin module
MARKSVVKMQQMKSGVSFVSIPKAHVKALKMKKGMTCICENNNNRIIYYPIK